MGNVQLFRKVIDAVKLGAAVIDAEHQTAMLDIGPELHGDAKDAGAVDLLINKNDAWHGFHTASHVWLDALGQAMKARDGSDNPIKNRMVAIVGINPPARILAGEVQRRGASAILASHHKKEGQRLAQSLGCRFVQFEALYTTMHDALIVCDEEKDAGPAHAAGAGIHAGYLKEGITVMDLTCRPGDVAFTRRSQAARAAC